MTAEAPVSKTDLPAPAYDPLLEFARWYMAQQGMGVPMSPACGTKRVGSFSGLVMYRTGQYQVELWIADPNSELPEHQHPNVDQIQVYLSGQVWPTKNGVEMIDKDSLLELPDGRSNLNGVNMRVKPGDKHGLKVGPLGGAFLNFQRWTDGVTPRSIHLDWIGEPLNAEHAVEIKQR